MFFFLNNTVSKILALATCDTSGNLFYFIFLASFSKLKYFTTDLFAKEFAPPTFSSPELDSKFCRFHVFVLAL